MTIEFTDIETGRTGYIKNVSTCQIVNGTHLEYRLIKPQYLWYRLELSKNSISISNRQGGKYGQAKTSKNHYYDQ